MFPSFFAQVDSDDFIEFYVIASVLNVFLSLLYKYISQIARL